MIKFITTINLKKMNTAKLNSLHERIFGYPEFNPYQNRYEMIRVINAWMNQQAVAMLEALSGFKSNEAEFYHNLSTAFAAHMVDIGSHNVAAISGWRFDQAWKLINGGLKNQEIAAILSSPIVKATTGYLSVKGFVVTDHPAADISSLIKSSLLSSAPVTAKDVANVRYGQVKDNMKKRAARQPKKSIEANEVIIVEHVPEGYYAGLGLVEY